MPADPSTPLKLLAAGKVDLAISYEPELLLARDKGAPLVAVGALVQRPLTSIISVDQKVKRLARPGRQDGRHGGDPLPVRLPRRRSSPSSTGARRIKEVNVGFNLVPAMLAKKVDATLGGFWNYEGIQLRQRRKHPLVIPVDQAGVPTYDELVVVARRDTLRNRGRDRALVRAGARRAATPPPAATPRPRVDALVGEVPDLAKARDLQAASVRATLPAFFPTAKGRAVRLHGPRGRGRRTGPGCTTTTCLSRPPHADFALTNEFLAGQGAG